jgi:MFS family permease
MSNSPTILATKATLLAGTSLTVMANATISPALPALRDHFATVISIDTLVGMVMTLPSLAVAIFAAPLGSLADRFGKRRLLLWSLIVYAAGGLSGWFAESFTTLLGGRLVLGLGVAGLMTAVTALVADLFEGPQRNLFLGQQGAAQSVGGVVFLLAGGLLASLGWRWPFLIYGASLLVWMMAWQMTVKSPARQIEDGIQKSDPLPLRSITIIVLSAFFAMVAFYIVPTKLPFLLRSIGVEAPWLGGVTVAATTLTAAITSLLYRFLRARFREGLLLALVFASMAIGYAIIAYAAIEYKSLAGVIAGAAIAGVGVGGIMPLLSTALFNQVPASRRGTAAGLLTAGVFTGQFISPLISAPIAQNLGYGKAFAVFSGVLAIAALFTLAQTGLGVNGISTLRTP